MLNVCEVTNIAQRHANPELQPASTEDLYPSHKQLHVRRSVRCKVLRVASTRLFLHEYEYYYWCFNTLYKSIS